MQWNYANLLVKFDLSSKLSILLIPQTQWLVLQVECYRIRGRKSGLSDWFMWGLLVNLFSGIRMWACTSIFISLRCIFSDVTKNNNGFDLTSAIWSAALPKVYSRRAFWLLGKHLLIMKNYSSVTNASAKNQHSVCFVAPPFWSWSIYWEYCMTHIAKKLVNTHKLCRIRVPQ